MVLVFGAGLLVGAVGVALTRPVAPPVVAAAPDATGPVPTVYVPAPLADTPSEAERVEFEKFGDRFIRAWVQPGPVAVRRQMLAPMVSPASLETILAKDQDRLPTGLPVGPPQIASTSPIGGLYLTKLSSGQSVQLVVARSPQGWKVDWIEG